MLTQNKYCMFTLSIHIPNLPLTDEKFESSIQDKYYKPHNQFFSRTSLSKTMIISDIMDFIKAISCSEIKKDPEILKRKGRSMSVTMFGRRKNF